MHRVTAMGCSLSAVIAACLGVQEDRFLATAAGLAVFSVAGEIAGRNSQGPGTFEGAFLDALYNMNFESFSQLCRIVRGDELEQETAK